ncbi:DUF1206 domain-containing protein [[Eubacterium] cellulosolvens]
MSFIKYFGDLREDIAELLDDFKEHLVNPFRRPYKIHREVKKKVGKRGRTALALAERIRGAIYVIVSLSIIFASLIALTEGVAGLREIVLFLVQSWFGRIVAFFVGIAYLVYGVWKIVMGSD